MSKRPSLVEGLDLTPTPPKPAKAKAKAKPAPSAQVVTLDAGRADKADVQHTSVYIPRAAYNRLREVAFTENCKLHALIMEGIDRVLADRGHSETALRQAKAS